jgi:thioredoxin 1
MAQEYKGRVKVVKLNTDENKATAAEYGIQSIPTFMVFVDGEMIERRSGANPRTIRDMIEESLITAE